MSLINLLSQSTIDKISAGEVVERPLSVVKELTENAIDAGSSAITVEIREGGISLIRVTDNGCGIEKSQIRNAFLRHATSKITAAEDLEHISSLGFRGEALSSIAAVAQVEVITKTPKELTAVKYSIAGGKEEPPEEIGAPNGSTFLVHNLFFNTPARRKFLKQPQTEGSYVADLMEHLALSHPEISIKYINNGQVRFHTSGNGDLKEVIYRVYGREITDALLPISVKEEAFTVFGYLGRPEISRSSRNFETCFVNGRYSKNDLLTKAVEEGYRPYLMQHKFPFAVLHFEIETSAVDVNVHPTKMEIRLARGNEIYEKLSGAITRCLHQAELILPVRLTAEAEPALPPQKTPEPFEVNRMLLQEESTGYKTAAADRESPKESNVQDFLQKIAANKILGEINTEKANQNEGIHANVIKASEHIFVEKPVQLDLFEERFLSPQAREQYRILGQLFDTYWLIAFQDKLMIMDQHAAHEKVKYERLIKRLHEEQTASQMLNPPVILSLTGREEEILQEYLSIFKEMGFEIEEFGGASYAVRSMPTDLYGCSEKELFTDLLDEIGDNPMKGQPETVLHKLAAMACKSAVKGNNRLSTAEAEALLDELLTLENPYHCPHGRPTVISMSRYEIEKKFKRIV